MQWFDKEYQIPQSIAVIWSPEVLTVPGQQSTRGFGGRIYFYNAKSQAIPVDGDLIVYAYRTTDEHRRSADLKVAADKKFAFTAEQLTRHFSPSQLGASYSIWIPWGDAEGFREEITLIPTFKSKDGAIVQGAPAKVFLPGKARDGEEELPVPGQQVSYRHSTTPAYDVAPSSPGRTDARSGLETTTISVPLDSSLTRPRAVSASGPNATGGSDGPNDAQRRVWTLPPTAPTPTPSAGLAPGTSQVEGATHSASGGPSSFSPAASRTWGNSPLSAEANASAAATTVPTAVGFAPARSLPGRASAFSQIPADAPPTSAFRLQPWTERVED
ncbi:MAG: hypothetical protein D6753_03145 [Planctomycetota bacterium]|nr:MAG: hypothetical protein D6753_03145 [Planctomycetota bacterium]